MCYNEKPVHTEKINGFTVEIWHDSDAMSPVTNFDLPGLFANYEKGFYGGRLIDTNDKKNADSTLSSFAESIRGERYSLVFSFYADRYSRLYPHRINWYDVDPDDLGGISGFYVMSKADIAKEWGTKRAKVDGKWLTPTQQAEKYGKSVLGEIADYYEGNVYGFKVIDPKGEEIDSCWGFIGDYDGRVLEEAKSIAEHAAKESADKKAAKKAKKAEAKQFVQNFFHL